MKTRNCRHGTWLVGGTNGLTLSRWKRWENDEALRIWGL